MERTDPYSNELFTPKRRHQRFASPRNKSLWHQQKRKQEEEVKRFFNEPLDVNHRVLMELIKPMETKQIERVILEEKQFNFSIMSHYEQYDNKVYPALFNFVLLDFGSNKASLNIHRKI